MIKIKNMRFIAYLLMVVFALFMGCASDESPVAPTSPLTITISNGPSGDVPFNAYVTFKWKAGGGSGNYVEYTYQVSGIDASANTTTENSVTYSNLSQVGAHTFTLTVKDSKGATASVSQDFTIVSDTAEPTVEITLGPAEGSKVAENQAVTFSWGAADEGSFFGAIDGYEYSLTSDAGYNAGTTSMISATSASFDSLPSGAYTFKVKAVDNAGLSAMDSVHFSVMKANILWIDDHDMGGLNEEFLERKEWATAFNGFAWTEFDMVQEYTVSSSVTADKLEALVNGAGSTIETVVWDESGTDDFFMMWYSTNGVGSRTPWLFNHLDNGGNLVLIGSNIMGQIWNSVPPAAGDFEDVYQGLIPDTQLLVIDTTVTNTQVYDSTFGGWITVIDTSYDTTAHDAWEADDYVTLTGDNGYTNITIDVGKDAFTHQDGIVFPLVKSGTKVILWDDDVNFPVGFVYETAAGGKVVSLGMNLYFSPTGEIRDMIAKILTDEFGH